MTADAYTMELRLCDDTGMVSLEAAPDCTPPKTYLDVLNVLRSHTKPFGEHKPVTESFACTGSAHLAGQHIRCTSPAHAANHVDALDAALRSGDPISIGDNQYVTGTNINGWQVSTTGR
jgi:hypothetical protein